jgi:hypothetical protein
MICKSLKIHSFKFIYLFLLFFGGGSKFIYFSEHSTLFLDFFGLQFPCFHTTRKVFSRLEKKREEKKIRSVLFPLIKVCACERKIKFTSCLRAWPNRNSLGQVPSWVGAGGVPGGKQLGPGWGKPGDGGPSGGPVWGSPGMVRRYSG